MTASGTLAIAGVKRVGGFDPWRDSLSHLVVVPGSPGRDVAVEPGALG
jgi:hypothetical protein